MAASTSPPGDRIAKVIARAGRASRREAERLIAEGRVAVNGQVIDRAALNVTAGDRITVDGTALDAPEAARLWLYHKPTGLVTTTRDEQGRPTIYDDLPDDLPRVMTIGRLDLNSEGLLLLTNDGGLKRKLELPSTGWLRRYRVRVNGRPTDAALDPLRAGVTVEGEAFQPMTVTLDRQKGANAWLTIGLREGRNREIRRALGVVGLTVNRLIRLSYGPFQLGQLKPGGVEEVRPRILRDQLGLPPEANEPGTARTRVRRPAKGGAPRGKLITDDAPRGGGSSGGKTVSRSGRPQKDAPAGRPGKAGPPKRGPKTAEPTRPDGPHKGSRGGTPGRADAPSHKRTTRRPPRP